MKRIYLLFLFIINLYADPSFGIIPEVKIDNMGKYYLGKQLFFDSNLSSDKKVSCSTCHDLNLYGTDNRTHSNGISNRQGVLNSPTIYNSRFNIAQDNAGVTTTIKQRSEVSFEDKSEMNGDIDKTINYIYSTPSLYKKFLDIYGKVTKDNIFESIAYFVEHILSPNSKFDKFLSGNNDILDKEEKKGYLLFKDYGCVSCHNGVNIGGNMYQKIGIFKELEDADDTTFGRYSVTKDKLDINVFKVPSLRNIAKTAPYLHDGSIKSLDKVIEKMGALQLGTEISQKDIYLIEKFLNTLTGDLIRE